MALNKLSRVRSLPPGEASKLLPPEIVRMAQGLEGGTSRNKKVNKVGAGDPIDRLVSKTKGRDFDTDPDLVHKKSPWDYIPPAER